MIEKLREFLNRRRNAYRRLFNLENLDVQFVLQDLAKFCRAHETTFHPDDRTHALLEGRREVFQRIIDHTNLSFDDLYSLYGGRNARNDQGS